MSWGFTYFYRILPSFTMFYSFFRPLLGFIWFYWVSYRVLDLVVQCGNEERVAAAIPPEMPTAIGFAHSEPFPFELC